MWASGYPAYKNMSSRISIACERCRFSKRRCRPPFPCTSCLSAGVRCDVRKKARPQRRGKPLPSDTVLSPSSSSRPSYSQPDCDNTGSSITDSSVDNTPSLKSTVVSLDVFEVVKELVARRALDYYGQKLECNLPEPKSPGVGKIRQRSDTSVVGNIESTTSINQQQAESLITALADDLGQIQSVDIPHLFSTSQAFFDRLCPRTCLGETNLSTLDLPIDSLAFLFASLALACVMRCHNFNAAYSFFHISVELLEEYTDRSSLDLVSAYFMQHLFILRTGSSNRAKSVIVQAIQAAHDLGIHKGARSSHGLQHVRLYLLLYFADQYLAMSHNTAPIIKAGKHNADLFEPLARAEPHLQTFIELVRINGHIFEHVYGSQCTYADTLHLESKIEQMCAAIGRPYLALPDLDNSAPKYEALVRIHMFWSRIMLRAPFIGDSKHWISSISICIRAAQMLLSIYLLIYKPSAIAPDQPAEHIMPFQPQFLQVNNNLPLTWRQVKRIVTSALLIVYAHWHDEASHEETCRGVATALLLLKCQRIRWKGEIDGAVKTLYALANLSNLKIEPYLSYLLPGATTDVIRSVAGDHASSQYKDVQVRFRTAGASSSDPRHSLETDMPVSEVVSQADAPIYGAAGTDDMYGNDLSGGDMYDDDFYGLLSVPQTIDDGTWMPNSSWSIFGDM